MTKERIYYYGENGNSNPNQYQKRLAKVPWRTHVEIYPKRIKLQHNKVTKHRVIGINVNGYSSPLFVFLKVLISVDHFEISQKFLGNIDSKRVAASHGFNCIHEMKSRKLSSNDWEESLKSLQSPIDLLQFRWFLAGCHRPRSCVRNVAQSRQSDNTENIVNAKRNAIKINSPLPSSRVYIYNF